MTQATFPGMSGPLSVPCPYPGHRYAPPCRARPGEPCRDAHRIPAPWFHAERRVLAGEVLPVERLGKGMLDADVAEEEGPEETAVEEEAPGAAGEGRE